MEPKSSAANACVCTWRYRLYVAIAQIDCEIKGVTTEQRQCINVWESTPREQATVARPCAMPCLTRGYQAPGWLLYKGHRHLHCRIIRWKLHKFHRFAASVGTDRNQGIACVTAIPYLDEAGRWCSPGGSSVPSQYTLIVQSPRSLESTHKWSAASVTSSDRCHYVSGS